MSDFGEVLKNPEVLYLMSIKRMAERIHTCIENTKNIYPQYCIQNKSTLIDTAKSTLYPNSRPNIIHFFGSSHDDLYNDVSLTWMRDAYETLIVMESSPVSKLYNHILLQCHPDGTWSLPPTLDDKDLHAAARLSFGTIISMISYINPVAAAPHMFCRHGLTTVRGLFEMLGIPVIGNTSELMALSTNKWQTRCILEGSGVHVPKGELLTVPRIGDPLPTPTIKVPFIIKPCSEGNSLGLNLYKNENEEDLLNMLEEAFKYDKEVLIE